MSQLQESLLADSAQLVNAAVTEARLAAAALASPLPALHKGSTATTALNAGNEPTHHASLLQGDEQSSVGLGRSSSSDPPTLFQERKAPFPAHQRVSSGESEDSEEQVYIEGGSALGVEVVLDRVFSPLITPENAKPAMVYEYSVWLASTLPAAASHHEPSPSHGEQKQLFGTGLKLQGRYSEHRTTHDAMVNSGCFDTGEPMGEPMFPPKYLLWDMVVSCCTAYCMRVAVISPMRGL